jgi:deazaflavin-dependent oxidoreductase (nitroreductase family)
MTIERKPISRLAKLGFKIPMWLYQAHLGSIFGGRIFAIVHHGRKSGKRYISGLEVLVRRDGELFVFSGWGKKADWFRNIEAGGVDELWIGRDRYDDVSFRVIEPDEAFEVLADYEREHSSSAKKTLPRTYEGYDFSDESRRELAQTSTLIAFAVRPSVE